MSREANSNAREGARVADTPLGSAASTLSVERAFVVQFREGSALSRRWQGRVEHIASGQAATFTSRAALLAFLTSTPRLGAGGVTAGYAPAPHGSPSSRATRSSLSRSQAGRRRPAMSQTHQQQEGEKQ